MDVKGKNVIISGGISGIGLATCKQLINCNVSSLAILDILENHEVIDELKNINQSINLLFIKTNVSNRNNVKNSFDEIIKEFKRIDIVLCNAGYANETEMEHTMNVNFFGVLNMTLTAIPLMSKSNGKNGGVIMATSSIAGLTSICFYAPAYTASKHAIVGFFRALSNEFYFNKHSIKFMVICPGKTLTPMIGLDHNIFDEESSNVTTEMLDKLPMQSADTMGNLMIDALKIGQNGNVWIANDGKLRQVEFQQFDLLH